MLPGNPAGLNEEENANKAFIISWPFHRRRYRPRYDEGVTASLAVLSPSTYHLFLSSTPTYFWPPSHIVCPSISITLGPNEGSFPVKCVRGSGDGDGNVGLTSWAPVLPLTFLVCLHPLPPALSSLCLDVYLSICLLILRSCHSVPMTVMSPPHTHTSVNPLFPQFSR